MTLLLISEWIATTLNRFIINEDLSRLHNICILAYFWNSFLLVLFSMSISILFRIVIISIVLLITGQSPEISLFLALRALAFLWSVTHYTLYLRLSAVLPACALSKRFNLKDALKATKGNSLHITLLSILTFVILTIPS